MYLGVDCGTQGTKVVVLDAEQKRVIAQGYSEHELISATNGRREQEPKWWIEAFLTAFQQAVKSSGIQACDIKAIGVSGQQHGLVVLDKKGDVIRPAKLWCDTETAPQNQQLLDALGGDKGSIDAVGLVIATGYTASKLLWLKQNEPENFSRIAHILLPHDYLNYWLTGNCVAEFGDASGTGFMDVRTRQWSTKVLDKIDGRLVATLPNLIEAHKSAGGIRPELAKTLGLNENVLVSSGGGDNMMGAIGTGNIAAGVVTISLGTSGTLYAYSDKPPILDHALVASFCSSSNGWLPLICTMNLTGVMNQFRGLFSLDIPQMNEAIANTAIGAEGITTLPFLSGERVPALPDANGSILGLNSNNFTVGNILRSAMEGTTFGLRYGMDLLRQSGIKSTELRLIGGGAKSPLWRQMIADVMNTKVVCPELPEAAAVGAAIQAQWCHASHLGKDISLLDLCEKYISIDDSSSVSPISNNVAEYESAYQRYRSHLSVLFPE
jgi:xylulokinase